jgi:hypothetical protein
VIGFDDVQWAEPTFLDLVEHVADWSRDAPILIVCVARPELLELRPGWGGGKLNATTVLLEPLSGEETDELIEELLDREYETTLYISGTVSNQGRFYPRFDAVVLLSAPSDVLLSRIESRTTNEFGKSSEERERIIRDIAQVEPLLRATATHEVDATQPVAAVVAELVAIGNQAG